MFIDVNAHPLGFYEDNKVTGIAIDLFQAVMTKLGKEVNFKLLPGKRVLHMLKKGEADGVPFIRKTPAREAFLNYCHEPLLSEDIFFYVNKDDNFTFNGDFLSLKDKKIAIILGDSHGEKFNRIADQLTIVQTSSVESSFEMLIRKRVDVVLSTRLRAAKTFNKLPKGKIVRISKAIISAPLYVAFSKKRGHEALRDQFDQVLKKMKGSGALKPIFNKWYQSVYV